MSVEETTRNGALAQVKGADAFILISVVAGEPMVAVMAGTTLEGHAMQNIMAVMLREYQERARVDVP